MTPPTSRAPRQMKIYRSWKQRRSDRHTRADRAWRLQLHHWTRIQLPQLEQLPPFNWFEP